LTSLPCVFRWRWVRVNSIFLARAASFVFVLLAMAWQPMRANAGIVRILPSSVATDPVSGKVTLSVSVQDPSAVAIFGLGMSYDADAFDVTVEPGADLEACAFARNDSVDGRICILITCHPALPTLNAQVATLTVQGNTPALRGLQFDPSGCDDPELAQGGCWLADGDGNPLSCGAFGASIDVVRTVTPTPSTTATGTATESPTASPTPTVSPTPMPPLSFAVAPLIPGAALPGGVACVGVKIGVGSSGAVKAFSSLSFGEGAALSVGSCSIHPAIGPASAFGKSLIQHVVEGDSERIEIGGTAVPLPDGVLFSCPIMVDPTAALGDHPFANAIEAYDADELLLGDIVLMSSDVRVTSCVGDCNGNGEVTLGEVQRCIGHFLGQALCSPTTVESSCPPADANHNGDVSIGEVTQCVNRFLGGC